MKCYIIGSAPVDDLTIFNSINKQSGDILVCADGGFEYARTAGLVCDITVGDFDSATCKPSEEECEVRTFNKDKDFTDARLAVEIGLERGYTEFEFYGCSGGRFDHMYANILLLLFLSKKGCVAKMIDHEAQYYFINQDTIIKNKDKRTVSLFSIGETVKGVTLEGFKYPLNSYDLSPDDSIGISNVIISETAKIKIKTGNLLIVEYNKEF